MNMPPYPLLKSPNISPEQIEKDNKYLVKFEHKHLNASGRRGFRQSGPGRAPDEEEFTNALEVQSKITVQTDSKQEEETKMGDLMHEDYNHEYCNPENLPCDVEEELEM